jgi:hypothetical protein
MLRFDAAILEGMPSFSRWFVLQSRARTAMFALNGLLLFCFALAARRVFGNAPQTDSIFDLLGEQIRRVKSEPLENISALRNPGIE